MKRWTSDMSGRYRYGDPGSIPPSTAWSFSFPTHLSAPATSDPPNLDRSIIHVRVNRDYIRFNQWSVPWTSVRCLKRKGPTRIQFTFAQYGSPLPVVDFAYLNVSVRPPKMMLDFGSKAALDEFMGFCLNSGWLLKMKCGLLGWKTRWVPYTMVRK